MNKIVKMGFDISTKKMGWCILVNNKPFKFKFNDKIHYSFGSSKLYDDKIKYDFFGNRMVKGTRPYLIHLNSILNSVLDAVLIELKNCTPNVIIALEFSQFNNIETSTKLALFIGKISQILENIIYEKMEYLIDNIEFKIVSANEWQRIYDNEIQDGFSNGLPIKWADKKRTLKLANIMFEFWGIKNLTNDDDLADALNLAFVAEKVKDNLNIKTINKSKRNLRNRLKTLNNRKEYWYKKAEILHKMKKIKNKEYQYNPLYHYEILHKQGRISIAKILSDINELKKIIEEK